MGVGNQCQGMTSDKVVELRGWRQTPWKSSYWEALSEGPSQPHLAASIPGIDTNELYDSRQTHDKGIRRRISAVKAYCLFRLVGSRNSSSSRYISMRREQRRGGGVSS